MDFIDNIKNRVKKDKKTIILPEASDVRVLEAASIIRVEDFVNIILIGKQEQINTLALENNLNIQGISIIDPATYDHLDDMANEFYLLRKHKGMSLLEAKDLLMNNYLYFANMLLRIGMADGVVSGAIHSSADTLRPALQIIKAVDDESIASSFFLMDVPNCDYGENGVFLFSDCGLIQNPTSNELVNIANSCARTFSLLVEKEPIIAMLSHSTFGTSQCSDTERVEEAVRIAHKKYPFLCLDGEMQVDAAIVPEIAKIKAPKSKVAGRANVLIFPSLDAGNIGYKLVERLAKAKAYGPLTQGLSKPVNDLSRGCSVLDIVGVVAITALQAMDIE